MCCTGDAAERRCAQLAAANSPVILPVLLRSAEQHSFACKQVLHTNADAFYYCLTHCDTLH
jgi:hypothetical protein